MTVKEKKDFEKKKSEDSVNDYLNLKKLLSQLKTENAFHRQQNNEIVDKRKNIETNPSEQKSQTTSTTKQDFIQSLYQDRQRHLLISHQARDLNPSTANHSYSSAKLKALSNIVNQYHSYHTYYWFKNQFFQRNLY